MAAVERMERAAPLADCVELRIDRIPGRRPGASARGAALPGDRHEPKPRGGRGIRRHRRRNGSRSLIRGRAPRGRLRGYRGGDRSRPEGGAPLRARRRVCETDLSPGTTSPERLPPNSFRKSSGRAWRTPPRSSRSSPTRARRPTVSGSWSSSPAPSKKGQAITAFCMGEEGKISRIMAPLLGSAITYASLDREEASAPGQLTIHELRDDQPDHGGRYARCLSPHASPSSATPSPEPLAAHAHRGLRADGDRGRLHAPTGWTTRPRSSGRSAGAASAGRASPSPSRRR